MSTEFVLVGEPFFHVEDPAPCAYAMCVHRDAPDMWHPACVRHAHDYDHYEYGGPLVPMVCAYCGSADHFPINCPKGAK